MDISMDISMDIHMDMSMDTHMEMPIKTRFLYFLPFILPKPPLNNSQNLPFNLPFSPL